MPQEFWSVISLIGAGLVTFFTHRVSVRAQERKAATDAAIATAAQKDTASTNSGELALKIAERLERELKTTKEELAATRTELVATNYDLALLKIWKHDVEEWWPEHESWDDRLLLLVDAQMPGTIESMGKPPRLPVGRDSRA